MADETPDRAFASGVRWELGDLYRDAQDPRLREDLDWAKRAAEGLAGEYRGRVERGELSPEDLARLLARYEEILERGTKPSFYASLLFAADTQDEDARSLEQWAREAWSAVRNELVFLELEIQKIPAGPFERALAHPSLENRRHYLELARRHRPYTLTEPEEKLLNQKELTSRSAFLQLYDELSGSLRFELELDGEIRTLTDGEILALLHHPERDVRRRAMETFLETYRRQELVFTTVFNNLLLDHRLDVDLRKFPSTIAPRHLDNDVEPETVEAMMAATERHYADAQEYFRLKGQLLELPEMSISDVYAPLGKEAERIPFAEARRIVLDAFAGFSPRIGDLARRFFEERWIDAEVRPGKRGGAFCASHSPRHHPYVLTSYAGTSRDVSTLAHELGHGVHSLLASRQPELVFDPPLVLAETASVFAEMLLTDHLLQRFTSGAARARILCDTLDEIYGTVFRQNALTRFELAAHQARRDGRLGAADLGRLWMGSQRALFGDAVAVPEIYSWGWIYIPHFVHSPFYCYSYSFGNLLVLALFERYREEGPAFVPRYLELLAGGGSDTPNRLLARMGLDLSQPEFWETGFRAIRRRIGELRETVAGG